MRVRTQCFLRAPIVKSERWEPIVLSNLRVVIVNNFSGPNAGRYGMRAIPLIKGLLNSGAKVAVVAAAGSGFAHAAIEAGAEVNAISMARFHSSRIVKEIKHTAWRMNANIVVGTGYFTNLLVRQAAPSSARIVNVVANLPSSTFEISGLHVEFSFKELIGQARRKRNDAYVAVSHAVAAGLAENGVDPHIIKVIPNGIDADAFVASAIDPTGSGAPKMPQDDTRLGGRPLVFAVARNLDHTKGVDILEESAVEVLRNWPADATVLAPNFRVAGTGMDKEFLNNYLRAEKIDDRFEIMGFAPQISPWYRESDIVVMPSRAEAVAVVALEAMVHGKPVIASDIGGIPEVVLDGKTGILVPSGDRKALASAITGLLLDPERAHALGEAGAKRVREHFSEQHMIDEYLDLFNKLVDAEEF